MKRLISAREVEAAAKAGTSLAVDGNTIVTPQAKDLARELGVELCEGCREAPAPTHAESVSAPAPDRAPAPPCPHGGEPALTADQMERVIRAAIDRGIWTPEQLRSLLGGTEG